MQTYIRPSRISQGEVLDLGESFDFLSIPSPFSLRDLKPLRFTVKSSMPRWTKWFLSPLRKSICLNSLSCLVCVRGKARLAVKWSVAYVHRNYTITC